MNLLFHKNSRIFKTLNQHAKLAKVVMFSGLPGVGKSLYVNQFYQIAQANGKNITVIQWDMARKAFETPEILAKYPLGDGLTHNGVLISIGLWIIDVLKKWLIENTNKNALLLIEAPLLGNRFIELAKIVEDYEVEKFLKSPEFQVIVPIPSKKLRKEIEVARAKDLSENATVWTGAKPSVMLMLWKMVCGIANKLGKNITLEGQPLYDPIIYEFVFSKVLKNRHFITLYISKFYPVSIESEDELHGLGSLKAQPNEANNYVEIISHKYPTIEELAKIVDNWYDT
jgi:hypothetical protein